MKIIVVTFLILVFCIESCHKAGKHIPELSIEYFEIDLIDCHINFYGKIINESESDFFFANRYAFNPNSIDLKSKFILLDTIQNKSYEIGTDYSHEYLIVKKNSIQNIAFSTNCLVAEGELSDKERERTFREIKKILNRSKAIFITQKEDQLTKFGKRVYCSVDTLSFNIGFSKDKTIYLPLH